MSVISKGRARCSELLRLRAQVRQLEQLQMTADGPVTTCNNSGTDTPHNTSVITIVLVSVCGGYGHCIYIV